MRIVNKIELLDEVCEQAYNTKYAETVTWAQCVERMHWSNLVQFAVLHAASILALVIYSFGLYSVPIKGWTIAWVCILNYVANIGVTAGAHRLWTHRCYKANLPLRICLMVCYSAAGLNSIFHWAKDHRVHHKYSETDADPHNAKRGFFFSHVGWLLQRRHPEYLKRAREIDLRDVMADPVVMFNKKWHLELYFLFGFIIPMTVPVVFWNETVMHVILCQSIRYAVGMNLIWSVNSLAHLYGDRPYNRLINPAENTLVSYITCGEGSHNYHHTFPWDYKASEFAYSDFNLTTLFIDAMAIAGWAYDLREPSPELVNKVIERIGHKSGIQADCQDIHMRGTHTDQQKVYHALYSNVLNEPDSCQN